jgi:hypothetical protein
MTSATHITVEFFAMAPEFHVILVRRRRGFFFQQHDEAAEAIVIEKPPPDTHEARYGTLVMMMNLPIPVGCCRSCSVSVS